MTNNMEDIKYKLQKNKTKQNKTKKPQTLSFIQKGVVGSTIENCVDSVWKGKRIAAGAKDGLSVPGDCGATGPSKRHLPVRERASPCRVAAGLSRG